MDLEQIQTTVTASEFKEDEPLLGCLVLIAANYGRNLNPDSLIAGLPTGAGGMDPATFVRAAERAYLKVRFSKRRIKEIPEPALPVILVLNDNQACILQGVSPEGDLIIQFPLMQGIPDVVPVEEIEKSYSGYMAFCRPDIESEREVKVDQLEKGHWFWSTLQRYWPTYIQVAIAAVLVNLSALAIPLLTMTVYDRVVPNNALETLWVLVIGAGGVVLFDFILRTMRAYLLDFAGSRMDVVLSSRIFSNVLDISLLARPASSGIFANQLREFESVRDFFTSATLTAFIDLPFALLFIGILFILGGHIAWVPVGAIPILIIGSLLLQIPLRRAVRNSQLEAGRKHGVLVESITGIETIKAVGAQNKAQFDWETSVGASSEVSRRARFFSGLAANFSHYVQQMATILVLVVGVHLVASGDMTSGAIIAGTMLTGRAMGPLGQVANLLTRYNQSRHALANIDDILNLPKEHAAGKTFIDRPVTHGSIEFKNVVFTYPEAALPTFDNVSFKINPGERLAIIGRIGSGKTTLARLILGLYEPQSGSVLIDGTDIRQLDPVNIRKAVGYMPQDPFLFRGSVKDNILMRMPNADDADILRAAKLAGLDDFISKHPQGYDLQVGERGERLSGGQRQTVIIARALLGEPPILIMDEPSASMDSTNEQNLLRRLAPIVQGKTMILMTHRTPMLALVDRIIVLDQGKLVADGPKDQVIEALRSGRVQTGAV